jgi:ubiquitin thioesterase protein OTUB1
MADYDAEIREAEARKPFVADKEPWSALAREYERGAAAFGRKIAALGATYGALRRTRGDGNCFFRAVCFAQLEHLVQRCASGGGAADVARFAGVVEGWRGKLLAAGYQELVFEDALDALLGLLRLIDGSAAGGGDAPSFSSQQQQQQQQRLTLDGLVSYFRDDITSNTAVMLLRMVASAELLTRAEFFAPFVAGAGGGAGDDASVEAFCRRCVEPMGEESDNIQAVALTDAMQLPVRVVYLDSRDGGGGGGGGGEGGGNAETAVSTHDFVPEACGADAKPVVHVLYRPGHYDICYPLLVAPPR